MTTVMGKYPWFARPQLSCRIPDVASVRSSTKLNYRELQDNREGSASLHRKGEEYKEK